MKLAACSCRKNSLGFWEELGVAVISSIGGKKASGPYTVCGDLTVDKAAVAAAGAANLPGVPAFDGQTGWTDSDCVRMRAYLAAGGKVSTATPQQQQQNAAVVAQQSASNYMPYILGVGVLVGAYLLLRK